MAKGKRVSNKPGGAPGARSGHVRFGFWRQRKLKELAAERAELNKDLVESREEPERREVESQLRYIKNQMKALLPKRLLRRPRAGSTSER